MKRESFVFYQSFWNATKHLPKDNQKNALVMIVEYGIDGIEPNQEIDPIAYAMFVMAKPQLDKNNQRFSNGVEGGRPKKNWDNSQKPNGNQTVTKPEPNVNVNVNVNDNVKVKRKEQKIVASFENFITALDGNDWKTQFPNKNIEVEQKRCWAKLGGKMKNAKSTFTNWLLPHKRDKEYIDGLEEKTDDQWITEFLSGKNAFNNKYGFNKYQEVKDKRVARCLAQPLSL